MKRRYVVTVPVAEAARLRAFDNRTHARKHWPLGPNRSFRRANRSTFTVKEYAGSAMGGAMVTTLGRARLPEDGDRMDVTVATRGHGYGYLLIAGGVAVALAAPRDGIAALGLGTVLVLAGWFLFARRPGMARDLDDVEKVLRANIRGHWQVADEAADAAYAGPPRNPVETANRLTRFLNGDDRDALPAQPAGRSAAGILPGRTALVDGVLHVRRRGRLVASFADGTVGLAQVSWGRGDLLTVPPAVETWVVDGDGRPVAVVAWHTRLEGQVRDAGLTVRRFAHAVDRDVVPHVWPGRPTRPVTVDGTYPGG